MLPETSHRYKVGVRLPDWLSGYAYRLFEGLVDFQRTGVSIELHFDQPSGGDLPHDPIDKSWKGDGLLVYRYSKEEARAWKKAGIKVINLSTEYPGAAPEIPRVIVDNQAVGRAGFDHLQSLGLRDFAYVHESNRQYSKERMEAFEEQVVSNGLNFYRIDVPASSFPIKTRPKQVMKCLQALKDLPRPCGLLSKDDIAGVSAIRVMKSLGIKCPEQMAIIGVSNDVVFCHTTYPPLTSIPYPGRKIGYAAAELLYKLMEGEEVSDDYTLKVAPGTVVARESTRYVILPDPVVTAALEYIRTSPLQTNITVEELCRKAGVSREGLRQKFQATLGRSPKQELERVRCYQIVEILRNSTETLSELSEICGFSGPDHLCRFVKRLTGKTPGEIRRG
ncbi:LacI family transcriptional regulator [Rubritalea squalenifaciens DSM 18772]|uniref:LacI family transcriptional regulator n=1 Tax=Rubritalea squalenifaciens DSM 18772 TaxID=1123071 RepID=A0A1M6PNA6_9BACT|nr:DNA-binding transcriptional regulator [Rubritalea squalenifaciens]SHK09380.1 LacI family transcriptional regulator [Rubritalea squalenifaciens DSM 18772]